MFWSLLGRSALIDKTLERKLVLHVIWNRKKDDQNGNLKQTNKQEIEKK